MTLTTDQITFMCRRGFGNSVQIESIHELSGGTFNTAYLITSATLSTAEIMYTLGGVTNTWGRAWTNTDFNDANFRIRLVMVASNTSRDFSLNWVGAQMRHTP